MRPAHRHVPLSVSVTILFALLFVGCRTTATTDGSGGPVAVAQSHSSGSGTSVPGTEPAPIPGGGTITWTSCGGPTQCGTLAVPLDWATPDGPTISLAVARRPARDAAHRIGSLFVNPGGPGASGVEFVQLAQVGTALTNRFDLVSWDPRGVGRSAPVDCDVGAAAYRALDWSPDDDHEARQLDDAAQAIADGCARRDGDRLDHVATDDTARDLDALRAAVGDERLTYLGYSYGTYIGERYAALFPTHVRAVVLDGVVDPNQDLEQLLLGQTDALERQIDTMFATCAGESPCPVVDPAASYDRLARQAEQAPIGTGHETIGPTGLAFAAVSSSYDASLGPVFLRGLADAESGDASTLAAIADQYFSSGAYSSYLAVLCTDNPHPAGGEAYTRFAETAAQHSPRFGAAIANEVRPCAFWPAPVTGSPGPVHAAGSPPILVVGNQGDVATPFADAEKVARDLDHGVLLTYDGGGHTSYGKNDCVDSAVEAYLVSTTLPSVGTVCR